MATSAGVHTDAGTALQANAIAELTRAIDCLGWRGAHAHAGVHQARKSIRRLRATLALGGTALGPAAAVLDRELRRLNRGLSPVRDAQALVETLDRLARQHGSEEEHELLRRARRVAVRTRSAKMRDALAADPGFQRRRELLHYMKTVLPGLPWPAVSADMVSEAVAHGAKAVNKAAKRAQASGRDEDWHRWRRRARRLSQQQRVLAAAQLPTKDAHSRKAVAVLLGEAQDYSLLREHCKKDSPFSEPDRLSLRKLAARGSKRLRRRIAKAAAKSLED